MKGMRTLGVAVCACLTLAAPTWAIDDTVYINDLLRVGVRTEPDSNDAPITIVKTGDRLELLERRDGFMRVRTPAGIEGWINDAYATSELPARERVRELTEENTRLQEALAATRATVEAAVAQSERLKAEQAQREQAQQEQQARQADVPRPARAVRLTDRAGLIDAARFVGLFVFGLLLGALLGVQWHRRKMSGRFNGLEL